MQPRMYQLGLWAGLWVLIDNHGTRRFYEAMGGRTGAERELGPPIAMREIAYVWDDLAAFGTV